MKAQCYDCGLGYGEGGFEDLVIPNWAWRRISPTKNEGGLLCPTCIQRALKKNKIKCEGAFLSGNISSVSYDMMRLIRQVENLEEMKQNRDVYKGAWGQDE
jgi:hypothetical protein